MKIFLQWQLLFSDLCISFGDHVCLQRQINTSSFRDKLYLTAKHTWTHVCACLCLYSAFLPPPFYTLVACPQAPFKQHYDQIVKGQSKETVWQEKMDLSICLVVWILTQRQNCHSKVKRQHGRNSALEPGLMRHGVGTQ